MRSPNDRQRVSNYWINQPLTVRARTAFIFILCTQLAAICVSQTPAKKLIGSWKIEVTFSNGQVRSCRFDARPSGQGSLTVLVPPQVGADLKEPAPAEWSQRDNDSVTIFGAVQFPVGNVGLERGTLVLEGKFGPDGSIAGEAKFFSADQDAKDPQAKPSKNGTFKATRETGQAQPSAGTVSSMSNSTSAIWEKGYSEGYAFGRQSGLSGNEPPRSWTVRRAGEVRAQKDGVSPNEQGQFSDAFVSGFDAAFAKFSKKNTPNTPTSPGQ